SLDEGFRLLPIASAGQTEHDQRCRGPCGIESERCLDCRQQGAHADLRHIEHELEAPFASANTHTNRHLFELMTTEPLPHQELLRRDKAMRDREDRLRI